MSDRFGMCGANESVSFCGNDPIYPLLPTFNTDAPSPFSTCGTILMLYNDSARLYPSMYVYLCVLCMSVHVHAYVYMYVYICVHVCIMCVFYVYVYTCTIDFY